MSKGSNRHGGSRDGGTHEGGQHEGGKHEGVLEKISTAVDIAQDTVDLGNDVADLIRGDRTALRSLVADGTSLIMDIADVAAPPIIAAGLEVLDKFGVICGDPVTPDVGAMFDDGASAFEDIEDALKQAVPSGSWTGASADKYALADAQQVTRAADMAKADARMQQIIADEAEQVIQTRECIDDCAEQLKLAIIPALAALAPIFEPEGAAVSIAIQIAAVATTVPPATLRVTDMGWASSRNAADIRQVAGDYHAVAGQHVVSGFGWSQPGAPGAPAPGSSTPVPTAPRAPGMPTTGPSTPFGPPGSPGAPGLPGGSAPPGGAGGRGVGNGGAPPAGGGAAPGGGVGAASGGGFGGGGLGGGGAAPAATAPAGTGVPAAQGGGVPSGGLPAGVPAGGAPGGAGSGLLASVLGPVVQAVSQLGQDNPDGAGQQISPAGVPGGPAGVPGSAAGQAPTAGVRPAELVSDKQAKEDEKKAGQDAEADAQPVPGAGAGSHGPRAPIHVELEIDPEQLKEPVHLVVDPKNLTPPASTV